MGVLSVAASVVLVVVGTRGERRPRVLSELDVYRRCYADCGRHPCER